LCSLDQALEIGKREPMFPAAANTIAAVGSFNTPAYLSLAYQVPVAGERFQLDFEKVAGLIRLGPEHAHTRLGNIDQCGPSAGAEGLIAEPAARGPLGPAARKRSSFLAGAFRDGVRRAHRLYGHEVSPGKSRQVGNGVRLSAEAKRREGNRDVASSLLPASTLRLI
jgi:hypothetical protein